MFGFDSKKCFFGVPYVFCFFVLKWKKNKKPWCFGFLNGYDQSRYQKNEKKLKDYLVFQHFRFKVSQNKKMFFLFFHFRTKKLGKTKKTIFRVKTKHHSPKNCVFVFLFCSSSLFVFGFSIDLHDCHLCPYAYLPPYRSWEVKF